MLNYRDKTLIPNFMFWFFGVFFLLGGIGMMVPAPRVGIPALLIGLALLPPIRALLGNRSNR